MGPFVEQIHKTVVLIAEKIKNMDTKTVALGILPSLVEVSKNQPGFDHIQYSKMTFGYLWEVFVEENDSSYKSEFCYSL